MALSQGDTKTNIISAVMNASKGQSFSVLSLPACSKRMKSKRILKLCSVNDGFHFLDDMVTKKLKNAAEAKAFEIVCASTCHLIISSSI